MKCPECKSCLKLLRYDTEEISNKYYYCYLCNLALLINNNLVNKEKESNTVIINTLKERYESLYGKNLN